ncbi:hypothetical protein SS50377_20974 [Spironucleus salmonicida]|uniref:Uncharacterized protein n=1 Tax=Spironucleus salmonicida TaxID=348837 RepID=V6LS88_9EUKA|nr:hypothetical protein SS50377_20974 [Spironucleus salmonicida]|eukprot:EST43644.1 Hypothetical protein SS50377_16687 [Spironucleus salmonicida]
MMNPQKQLTQRPQQVLSPISRTGTKAMQPKPIQQVIKQIPMSVNVQSQIKVSRKSQKSQNEIDMSSQQNSKESPKTSCLELKNPLDVSYIPYENNDSLFSVQQKNIPKTQNLFESDINLYVSQDQTLQFIEPKDKKKVDDEQNFKKLTELIGAPKWKAMQKTNKIGILNSLYTDNSKNRSPMHSKYGQIKK